MPPKAHNPTATPNDSIGRLVRALDGVRRDRGQSKADVARGAKLGQPAVRRLLAGRHQNPTLKTLEAVAAHLGLRISLEPQPTAPIPPTLAELRRHSDAIERIVTGHHGCNVRVFGSVARGDAHVNSDIDLLVDVEPGTGLLMLGAMEDALALLLERKVDVVTTGHGRMQHIHDDAIPLR